MQEREPDLSDDPRKIGEGDGGYPEENPAGEDDGGDRGAGGAGDSAPDTEGGQDDSAEGATGNPGAAGA